MSFWALFPPIPPLTGQFFRLDPVRLHRLSFTWNWTRPDGSGSQPLARFCCFVFAAPHLFFCGICGSTFEQQLFPVFRVALVPVDYQSGFGGQGEGQIINGHAFSHGPVRTLTATLIRSGRWCTAKRAPRGRQIS